MILIDRKRARAPRELLTEGPKHLRDTIQGLVEQGTLKSDDFERSIYASDEVRARLWRMQHQKCCFCEGEYEIKHSTVEHFRPKTEASDEPRNRGNKRPGYWWLAYSFENLYFCCKNCNTPKSTYFPLASGATPLQPQQLPSTTPEHALLLDPGGPEDPEAHIEWRWLKRRQCYVPVGTTPEGRNTVHAVELDQRDSLNQLRAKYYRLNIKPILERHREASKTQARAVQLQAVNDAKRLCQPQAPYAGMARWLFRTKGLI